MSALWKECFECGTRFCKRTSGMRWWTKAQCCSNECSAAHRIERAWASVVRYEDPALCWIWTRGRSSGGYGVVGRAGDDRKAHRMAWRREYGEIPAGMHVLHRCDNPPCVRPSHLFLGTQADNNKDRDAKGRASLAGLYKRWSRGRKKAVTS